MKPSLLTIFFLTGSVHSRLPWDVFNLFFGNNEDDKENSIIFDDENRKASNRKLENSVDIINKESNDIPGGADSYQQKQGEVDNRIGDLDPVKGNKDEERYRKLLKKFDDYAKNLSGLAKGPQYWDILDNNLPNVVEYVEDDGFEW
ncbi:unnamed protein product, partial [Cylicostephanus goldi]